jgi:hypothetical protein
MSEFGDIVNAIKKMPKEEREKLQSDLTNPKPKVDKSQIFLMRVTTETTCKVCGTVHSHSYNAKSNVPKDNFMIKETEVGCQDCYDVLMKESQEKAVDRLVSVILCLKRGNNSLSNIEYVRRK